MFPPDTPVEIGAIQIVIDISLSNKEKVDYLLSTVHRDFELETFLTIRYDNHGQVISQHDPNKKKRSKGGWTTYFVRVKSKLNINSTKNNNNGRKE